MTADTTYLIVLGAGRPHHGAKPAALYEPLRNRRTFDWLRDAFRDIDVSTYFVGGYHVEELAKGLDDVTLIYNPNWETQGSGDSLLCAPLPENATIYVCYSDILFRPELIQSLSACTSDMGIVVDSSWRTRYADRADADLELAEKVSIKSGAYDFGQHIDLESSDSEFVGLIKLSGAALNALSEIKQRVSKADQRRARLDIPELMTELANGAITVDLIDAEGQWAELRETNDVAKFLFGTKAQTLERLRPLVRTSRIMPGIRIGQADWHRDAPGVIASLTAAFGTSKIIVRSSASTEDGWDFSNAGAYLSVANVDVDDPDAIGAAIDRVFSSYSHDSERNEVLVQEMVTDVSASGVALSRTLNHFGPYYSINFDDQSGRTDTVTSGSEVKTEHVLISRDATDADISRAFADRWAFLPGLLMAIREIEEIIHHENLDLEFAVDASGEIYIFQVRPLVAGIEKWPASQEDVLLCKTQGAKSFAIAARHVTEKNSAPAIFGVMPDWNPAEIIGTRPRPLALSLYRYLVTDETWALQRRQFGYRDLFPVPLMHVFSGKPYIDVCASLESFIPRSVDDSLAKRLVGFYAKKLHDTPALHDKIEFAIAVTCMSFDFPSQRAALLDAGFTPQEVGELEAGLEEINRTAVSRYESDVRTVDCLAEKANARSLQDLPPLQRALRLLRLAKSEGVLPFAHLARSAFVATTILRSAVNVGILEEQNLDGFLSSLETVAKRYMRDARLAATDGDAYRRLIATYGHLRPGTYEITSPTYADDIDRFFRSSIDASQGTNDGPADESSIRQKAPLASLSPHLKDLGLNCSLDAFSAYARASIEGREYAKFVFTMFLSQALDATAEFGNDLGVSRDDLSYVPLGVIQSLLEHDDPVQCRDILLRNADEWHAYYDLTSCVELPPLLTRDLDFQAFAMPITLANFVTAKNATAECSVIDNAHSSIEDLSNRIALIPQADPGYDWLFGHNLAGLITAYGGANSHMAVRAAEFQLPAAIGVGEARFEELKAAKIISLDCAGSTIKIIQ